jgi:hypothetical protein
VQSGGGGEPRVSRPNTACPETRIVQDQDDADPHQRYEEERPTDVAE